MRIATGIRTAVALFVALALAACSATRLTSAWLSDSYHGPAFKKIIVLGVSEDGATRRLFEDSFAASLTRSGVQAFPGYTLLPGIEDPTPGAGTGRGTARRRGRRAGDAAVAGGTENQVSPGYVRTVPAFGYPGGFYGFYGYYRTVLVEPRIYTYDVAELETNLWALDGASVLVWSATSQSFTPDQASSIGTALATEVSGALKAAGLIQLPPG
ncbi:MAG: hypothetical protein WDN04_05620 [Rhodospirillales bacterium]